MSASSVTPIHRRVYRVARLAVHLMRGQRIVRKRFPGLSTAEQDREIEAWSRQLLTVLAVDVRVHGIPQPRPRQCMMVANHISWLDIFILHAQWPGVFVAKSDIRDWPLIGSLVEGVGTLFISPGSRTHARRTNERIAQTLVSGRTVTVFPEGATSIGDQVARFHAALLQPAIDAEAALLPVGIRYKAPDGARTDAANYVGDMSFVESLWRIVSQPRLIAELHFTPPLSTQHTDRRALACESETAIARALDLPLRHSRTETRDDPPDALPSVDHPRHNRYPDPTDQDA